MSISLADVVNPTIGLQGALQGAGTPNQAGIGGFLPLSVGDNSVWFLDALVNASFADREGLAQGWAIADDHPVGFAPAHHWLNQKFAVLAKPNRC